MSRQPTSRACAGLASLAALLASVAATPAAAFPEPGPYRASGAGEHGILTVDETAETGTFALEDDPPLPGTFADESTLLFDVCVADPPNSIRNEWQFEFDTETSFTWTGTVSFFAGAGCAGAPIATDPLPELLMLRVDVPALPLWGGAALALGLAAAARTGIRR